MTERREKCFFVADKQKLATQVFVKSQAIWGLILLRRKSRNEVFQKKKPLEMSGFFFWSGLRGSNPPPPPWQGGALPNELNPQMVESIGLAQRELRALVAVGSDSYQLSFTTDSVRARIVSDVPSASFFLWWKV